MSIASPYKPRLSVLSSRALDGMYAVADQAAISGCTFIASILLVRWTSVEEFGAYAVSLSIFLIAAGVHNSFVLEPMSILGAVEYRNAPSVYVRAAIGQHLLVTGAMALLMVCASVPVSLLRSANFGAALLASAAAAPLVLLFWLARRVCYVFTNPRSALGASIAYLFATLTFLVLFQSIGMLTAASAILATAVGGAVGTAVVAVGVVRLPCWHNPTTERLNILSLFRKQWQYSKWALAITGAAWLCWSAYPLIVTFAGGLRAAGALRAAETLMQPIVQVVASLTLMLAPRVSRKVSTQGTSYLRPYITRASAVAALGTGIYCAAVCVAGAVLLQIFGAEQHWLNAVKGVLPFLGVAVTMRALSEAGFCVAFRASGHPRLVFHATATASIVTLISGYPLVRWLGLNGAGLTLCLGAATHLTVLVCMAFKFDITGARERGRMADAQPIYGTNPTLAARSQGSSA